ncbi:MAG: DNA primase, partial [Eubacteriales bacterium]|nr:DNA primase [Eubacteriales bacterium]
MKIPKNVLDEIEQRSDITDVIGSYVTLQRAGSNLKGLCPFHSEKTPSFTVYPASNSFYCFGCGAGGNVFTFIMKAENLDFTGAAELLANRAGIRIPQSGYDADDKGTVSRKRVYEINLAAAKYFRNCLFDQSTGAAAMNYLAGQRRLSSAVIKRFGLGYAPDSFSAFGDYMCVQGFGQDELRQSDLLAYSERSHKFYARFRNRVMFPIIDTTGNIIGFGGRVMDDSKPKYLNSSDTPGFKKSRNLFALNYAKNNCSDSMILCEGYMDVIALHAAGFENAVATLGTAITQEQARIIARYTKKVILIYDSDEAGRK